jgi:DNA-binding winged helix-turn-helix (wHTH) protein
MAQFEFADGWQFDSASGELRRGARVTRLEPQPAAVLALLASRPGVVVPHDEIARAVWGDDTHVNFRDGMQYCIGQARRAFGERAQGGSRIETIPRRGYRMRTATVAAPPPTAPITAPAPARPWCARLQPRWPLAVACVGLTLVATTIAVERRPNPHHHEIAVKVLKALHDLVY